MERTLLQLLREPIVQFLLIGTLLFGAHRYLQPAGSATPAVQQTQAATPAASSGPTPSRQIMLTLDQLTRLATVFEAQWGREPTPQELDKLVDADVKEEILYREGLALGLDKDDEIIRRRGVARRDAPGADLFLEHVRHEVAAMVMAQRQAAGGAGVDAAELVSHRHADGLKSFEAGPALGDMPTGPVHGLRSNRRRLRQVAGGHCRRPSEA